MNNNTAYGVPFHSYGIASDPRLEDPEPEYDLDRGEDEACEKGTPGCPVRHRSTGPEFDCDTW